jgi:transposase
MRRGRAGSARDILVSKYCGHLPLYRPEQIFAQRHKINLSRQTLASWVELCAGCLRDVLTRLPKLKNS